MNGSHHSHDALRREEASPLQRKQLSAPQRVAYDRIWSAIAGRFRRANGASPPREFGDPATNDAQRLAEQAGLPRIDSGRHSNVILIDGDRGNGKTTLLVSLIERCNALYLGSDAACRSDEASRDSSEEMTCHPVALQIIDLVPVMQTAPLLSLLIQSFGPLVNAVLSRAEKHESSADRRVARLKASWKTLTMATASRTDGVFNRGSMDPYEFAQLVAEGSVALLSIDDYLHHFISELSEALRAQKRWDKPPLFILPIDDADSNPQRTVELIQLFRTAHHPQLLFLLTASSRLMELVLENNWLKDLSYSAAPESLKPRILQQATQLAKDTFDRAVPFQVHASLDASTLKEALDLPLPTRPGDGTGARPTLRALLKPIARFIQPEKKPTVPAPIRVLVQAKPEIIHPEQQASVSAPSDDLVAYRHLIPNRLRKMVNFAAELERLAPSALKSNGPEHESAIAHAIYQFWVRDLAQPERVTNLMAQCVTIVRDTDGAGPPPGLLIQEDDFDFTAKTRKLAVIPLGLSRGTSVDGMIELHEIVDFDLKFLVPGQDPVAADLGLSAALRLCIDVASQTGRYRLALRTAQKNASVLRTVWNFPVPHTVAATLPAWTQFESYERFSSAWQKLSRAMTRSGLPPEKFATVYVLVVLATSLSAREESIDQHFCWSMARRVGLLLDSATESEWNDLRRKIELELRGDPPGWSGTPRAEIQRWWGREAPHLLAPDFAINPQSDEPLAILLSPLPSSPEAQALRDGFARRTSAAKVETTIAAMTAVESGIREAPKSAWRSIFVSSSNFDGLLQKWQGFEVPSVLIDVQQTTLASLLTAADRRAKFDSVFRSNPEFLKSLEGAGSIQQIADRLLNVILPIRIGDNRESMAIISEDSSVKLRVIGDRSSFGGTEESFSGGRVWLAPMNTLNLEQHIGTPVIDVALRLLSDFAADGLVSNVTLMPKTPGVPNRHEVDARVRYFGRLFVVSDDTQPQQWIGSVAPNFSAHVDRDLFDFGWNAIVKELIRADAPVLDRQSAVMNIIESLFRLAHRVFTERGLPTPAVKRDDPIPSIESVYSLLSQLRDTNRDNSFREWVKVAAVFAAPDYVLPPRLAETILELHERYVGRIDEHHAQMLSKLRIQLILAANDRDASKLRFEVPTSHPWHGYVESRTPRPPTENTKEDKIDS